MAISTANVTEPGSFGTSKPAFLEASIVRVLKLFILMLLQPWRTKDFSHPERSISLRQVRNLEICWKCGFHYVLVLDFKIQIFYSSFFSMGLMKEKVHQYSKDVFFFIVIIWGVAVSYHLSSSYLVNTGGMNFIFSSIPGKVAVWFL